MFAHSFMHYCTGVQLFMCLYALSVLLEAPTDTRRRRRPYLIVSFIVFSLFASSTALDAFYVQDIQFEAKAGSDIINSMILNEEPRHWARRASSLAMLGFVVASDGVLVSNMKNFPYVYFPHREGPGFPVLCPMQRQIVVHRPSHRGLRCFN